MNVEHLDAEPRGLDGGAQHLVRAVVKFEVEENFGAAPANLADEIGAAADEQRASDSEHPDHFRETIHQPQGVAAIAQIERYDQSLAQRVLPHQTREWPVLGHRFMKICRLRSK